MADQELSVDQVRSAAERGGFELTEAEASKLVKNASRDRRLAEVARKYATPGVEPAGSVTAGAFGAIPPDVRRVRGRPLGGIASDAI